MSNDSFNKKFKGQIQKMGKGGINSISPENNFNNYNQQPQNMMNMNNQNMMNMNNQNMMNMYNPNMMNMYNPNMMNMYNPNMMNMNNPNMMNMNNPNIIPHQINMNNNQFELNEINNNEKEKIKKVNNKKNKALKKGGEMIIKSNKNDFNQQNQNNPQSNYNSLMKMNQNNPQNMMNNPNFNSNFPFNQMSINNNLNQNQIQMNNNFDDYTENLINKDKKEDNKENILFRNKSDRSYHLIDFKPYSFKDYKELIRTPIIMGHLGANIGTKEWENKRAKRNRMASYSNRVSLIHKGITNLKKDTPKEEREKNLKKKYENSSRYKSYEYCKLIQSLTLNNMSNSRLNEMRNNENYYKHLGKINENDEFENIINQYNVINTSPNYYESNLNDSNNFSSIIKTTENTNDGYNKNNSSYNNNNLYHSTESKNELENLLQQNENYRAKIADLKDSLF